MSIFRDSKIIAVPYNSYSTNTSYNVSLIKYFDAVLNEFAVLAHSDSVLRSVETVKDEIVNFSILELRAYNIASSLPVLDKTILLAENVTRVIPLEGSTAKAIKQLDYYNFKTFNLSDYSSVDSNKGLNLNYNNTYLGSKGNILYFLSNYGYFYSSVKSTAVQALLLAYDFSNPDSPVLSSKTEILVDNYFYPYQNKVVGNYLVMQSYNNILIYNVAAPESPVLVKNRGYSNDTWINNAFISEKDITICFSQIYYLSNDNQFTSINQPVNSSISYYYTRSYVRYFMEIMDLSSTASAAGKFYSIPGMLSAKTPEGVFITMDGSWNSTNGIDSGSKLLC